MAAGSRSDRRRRVARGIYEQSNGRYAVCVMADGRPRFRTLNAGTISEARRQRELLQRIARIGELPVALGLIGTFTALGHKPATVLRNL